MLTVFVDMCLVAVELAHRAVSVAVVVVDVAAAAGVVVVDVVCALQERTTATTIATVCLVDCVEIVQIAAVVVDVAATDTADIASVVVVVVVIVAVAIDEAELESLDRVVDARLRLGDLVADLRLLVLQILEYFVGERLMQLLHVAADLLGLLLWRRRRQNKGCCRRCLKHLIGCCVHL